MKYALLLVLGTTAILLFSTCCDDEATPMEDTPSNPYEGCCDMESGLFTIGESNIYIPSAFTPNNDGVNDLFTLFGDEATNFVFPGRQFVITTEEGDELFREEALEINNPGTAWNGRLANGYKYEGRFNYELTLEDTLNVVHVFTGSACSLICEPDSLGNNPEIPNFGNCTFGLNHNGEGGYDPNLDSGENECF